MSQEHTDGTKLDPGFDAVGISTAVDQDYRNDWEMKDTASRSMRVVGEVVPEMDVSSLGLSPQVALTADSLRNVTGPSMAVARTPGDAGSDVNESLFTDANVAEITASGFLTSSDEWHPKGSIATSRRGRSKSPHGRTGRELSPKSQTAELRARMARVRQIKLTQYLPPAPQLLPPPVFTAPHDTVTRAEADAVLRVLFVHGTTHVPVPSPFVCLTDWECSCAWGSKLRTIFLLEAFDGRGRSLRSGGAYDSRAARQRGQESDTQFTDRNTVTVYSVL